MLDVITSESENRPVFHFFFVFFFACKDADRLPFREKSWGVFLIVRGGDRWREGGRGMMLEDEGKRGKEQTCWRRADMKERCISSLPNEVLMLGGGVTKTRESGGREKYLSSSYQ